MGRVRAGAALWMSDGQMGECSPLCKPLVPFSGQPLTLYCDKILVQICGAEALASVETIRESTNVALLVSVHSKPVFTVTWFSRSFLVFLSPSLLY